MGKVCSSTRILALLLSVFVAATIALAAYLIYDKTQDTSDSTTESTVVARYPGYFRTEMEQRAFVQELVPVISEDNSTMVPAVNNTQSSTCTFRCFKTEVPQPDENRQPARRRRSLERPNQSDHSIGHFVHKRDAEEDSNIYSDPIFHGCCISKHTFISPSTLPNRHDKPRVLAQFEDRRQYFLTQTCRHAEGCTGCQCGQEVMLVTAVVENVAYPEDSDQEYILEFVKMNGCCKCFNI